MQKESLTERTGINAHEASASFTTPRLDPIMHPRVSIWSGLVRWSHPHPSCAGVSKENGAIRHGLERAPSLWDAPDCCRRWIKCGFGVEMLAAGY